MEQRIELKPNCSLTVRGARWFFASICLLSFSFSLYFVVRGLWPVLPFWGLEMAALGVALYLSMQRRRYGQVLTITDSSVSLVTHSQRGEAKQDFARHWAKVRLRSPLRRSGTSRLTIESHGRAYEVGSFLTEEDRCLLAKRLGRLVGGMNESPPL